MSAFTGDFIASKKVSEVMIVPLTSNGTIDRDLGGKKILQYWPASLFDSKGANWQGRDIPGSPLPIYQWISGSERTLSFTTVFTRDQDGEIAEDLDEDKYNVDIDAAIAWLRMLEHNDYTTSGDSQIAVAPPVLWIVFAGTKLGYNSEAPAVEDGAIKTPGGTKFSNGVYCILNQVDVERTDWFPSGRPRYAEVSLSFFETMQIGQGIYPYGRAQLKNIASKYTRVPKK